ncbi:hypothetical protein DFR79_1564 [Halanaerobium saccharolyticum]|uniref:Uncharacterized protein n=1 Tax=Halanaerobium saccharolyticum TaxID=43595 RepID=A0A4V3CCZ0_9FIRM|nr:hypothetical protein DFR79_1564 [Halanaerobium saccharolyticum]
MNFNCKLDKNFIKGYEFKELYSYIHDEKSSVGYNYFLILIENNVLPSYIQISDDKNEIELILDSILYKKSKELNKTIEFSDLV